MIYAQIGLGELAERVGVFRRGVVAIARRLGLLPKRDWHRGQLHFNEESVAAVEKACATLSTTPQAGRVVGRKPEELGRIVAAGHLARLRGCGRRSVGGRYLQSDVMNLLARIDACLGENTFPREMTLRRYCEMKGVRPGDVVTKVLVGEIVPSRRSTVGRGVRSRLFDGGPLRNGASRGSRPHGLSQSAAQAIIGVSRETLIELNRRGCVSRIEGSGARRVDMLDPDPVRAFAERHVPGAVYCVVRGCAWDQVVRRLRPYGVDPLIEPFPRTRITPIFDRSVVRAALGLSTDPDRNPVILLADLWEAFRSELRCACPGLKVPMCLPTVPSQIWTGTRTIGSRLASDPMTGTISVALHISRKRSPRRWVAFVAARNELLTTTTMMTWSCCADVVEGSVTLRRSIDVATAVTDIQIAARALG